MFSPIRIKQVEIKNRIVLPPMVCLHWSDDSGEATARHVAHYEAIARGGCGLIIIEACSVSESARLLDPQLGIWSDAQIEGLRQITEACHRHGAKVLIQLCHALAVNTKALRTQSFVLLSVRFLFF